VRLHGLKVGCEKCVPVLPLVQRAGPTCGEEGRVCHAKKPNTDRRYGSTKLNEAIRVWAS
jgi:hypothetical protein